MKSIILPLITSLLFAGSFIAGKYTTIDLGPLTTSLLRFIAAFIFLSAVVFWRRANSLKIERKDWIQFMLLGLFGIVGYHFFFFSALRHTQVANTAIINALSPIVTAVMAAFFIRERLRLKNYIGVFLAVAGVLALLSKGKIENLALLNINVGDGLMLAAVISWALYALLVKKMSRKYSGFTITFYATLFGVLLLFIFVLAEDYPQQISQMSSASLLAVIYMGMGASGVGYLLYNMSIIEIGPTKTSGMVYSLVPIFVAVSALLLFGERISFMMILSAGMVLLGLHLMMQRDRM
jgi:drug/metabolite transporter (DMT)-like permease